MIRSKLDAVLQATDDRAATDLDDLFTLIRQPSISAQDVGVRD